MKVAVFLAKGFEETEAVATIDVLRRAGIEVITVSVSENVKVESTHSMTICADLLFEEVDFSQTDMIVLPGGMPGTLNLDKHDGLKSEILDFNEKGKYIAAICAAPLILGKLGILDGREATCFPGYENNLIGAKLSTKGVVVDNNIITGCAVACVFDFALKLVKILAGQDVADAVAEKMLLSEKGSCA